jgi:hypothetical protein
MTIGFVLAMCLDLIKSATLSAWAIKHEPSQQQKTRVNVAEMQIQIL